MSRREPAASPFRDLSNLRTPRPNPNAVPPSPQFFTASKSPLQAPTPTPFCRRRPGNGAPTPTPLGRRLRALEVDQSRSARRTESARELALRTFAASASSWLSLLLRDPSACGCSPAVTDSAAPALPCAAGKRGALDGERARGGRSLKRRRGGGDHGGERRKEMTPEMVTALRESLREACSLDDVTERMENYMSKGACEEVLLMMFQICKNIDEGRLKMKAQCPIVTDLRLKEKATKIFMSYNPYWLRAGLHIVLGGDSLLPTGQGKRDKEVHFLKLILEKHMFSQIVAKSSGHKKVLEEPNVQDYSEVVGNILLKRIFLLVVALDRAKIESALPVEAGIDGLDGGSPLLFSHQGQIKSSRQIIQESLRETMHGEGDILIHLTTMGYKLNYQQPALSEYDFTMRSLFEDLQDGIILCRVVQLLLADASIISKVIAPSDTNKKRLSNCTTAIQYIKQARVPLSDFDGVAVSAEDIAAGDKELILSLLWNMFIHMQLPLLASKTSLARELTRLNVHVTEQQMSENKPQMGLLCNWVQAICSKYGVTVESLSQFDRRALSCLINYYLNVDISPIKETLTGCRKELFTCHQLDTITDITGCPSSKMGKVLFDVLQAVDIPAGHILTYSVLFDEKSTILLLAFLSSHLTNDERLDRLKNLINMRLDNKCAEIKILSRRRSRGKIDTKYHPSQTDKKDRACTNQEWAATIIQTQARSLIAKNKYRERKKAIYILQGALRAWSAIILNRNHSCLSIAASTPWRTQGDNRYFIFIMERHRFVQMRRSAIMIQQAVRIWIRGRKMFKNSDSFKSYEFLEGKTPPKISSIAPSPQEHCSGGDKTIASPTPCKPCEHMDTLRASAPDGVDSLDSTTPLQLGGSQSNSITSTTQLCKSGHDAIPPSSPLNMFESNCWSCVVETSNAVSVSKLMSVDDMECSSNISSQELLKHVSACVYFPVCKELMAAQRIQTAFRRFLNNRNKIAAAIKIQSHWRCYSVCKCFTKQVQAIVGIQTSIRVSLCHQALQRHRFAAVLIQRVVRGWLARKRLLGSSSLRSYTRLCVVDQSQKRKCYQSLELNLVLDSVIRLQRCWRKFLLHQSVKASVISIQSFARGWLARKHLNQTLCCINIIQRWWRKVLESRNQTAIAIQTRFRGWIARQDASRTRNSTTKIQRWWRKVLESRKKAAIVIQTRFRGWVARQDAIRTRNSISNIQRWWRKVFESRKQAAIVIQTCFRGWIARQDAIRTRNSISNIQRWWRKVLFIKLRKQAVLVIQAHFRGWIARQVALRTRKSITTIKSYAKAYLERKASKQEVAHIRSRLQTGVCRLVSSSQVDDSMRLINRLVSALSKLRHCRSIHKIRQTCAKLSSATEYSKKCCETLVAAGAVDILLKQIHLLNRGIADQEVMKQVFLTLRNIARYANLRQVLASTPESAEIIFQELLRNKADGFFIASDILKSLCESKEGLESIQALSHLIKRLRSLVQDLENKVALDKRNGRIGAVKTNNLRRLREAATLYHLLTSDT